VNIKRGIARILIVASAGWVIFVGIVMPMENRYDFNTLRDLGAVPVSNPYGFIPDKVQPTPIPTPFDPDAYLRSVRATPTPTFDARDFVPDKVQPTPTHFETCSKHAGRSGPSRRQAIEG
jgi:hypothetical protein